MTSDEANDAILDGLAHVIGEIDADMVAAARLVSVATTTEELATVVEMLTKAHQLATDTIAAMEVAA